MSGYFKRGIGGLVVATSILALAAGCASVSTHSHERRAVPLRAGTPEIFYVQDFEAPADVFRVDRAEPQATTLRNREAARLTRNIVWRIREHLGPSVALSPNDPLPRGPYWLIKGRFIRVNQGSRALRMLVGFGAGGTKMETEVEIYDLAGPTPVLVKRFQTTGGSNAMPGAFLNLTWWSAAASGGTLALTGIRYDITRTSREITRAISQELALQGNHPTNRRPMRPKTLGSWP